MNRYQLVQRYCDANHRVKLAKYKLERSIKDMELNPKKNKTVAWSASIIGAAAAAAGAYVLYKQINDN